YAFTLPTVRAALGESRRQINIFFNGTALMDLHAAASEFFRRSKELLDRMKSSEGNTLTEVDLHILRVQCRLLDGQATILQRGITARRESPLHISPQITIKVLFIDPNDEIRQSWAEHLARYSSDYVVLHSVNGR